MTGEHDPNLHEIRQDHTPAEIKRRLDEQSRDTYVRDMVYGGIDGVITTFAIVGGVAGAELSNGIVIILGVSNLVADGGSMAAANFLGTRAENDHRDRTRRIEETHISIHPAGEREEVREIYRRKGFSGQQLEDVVSVLTADRQRWVDTMLTEEHGLAKDTRSAWRAAIVTFFAFALAGIMPLAPYLAAALTTSSLSNPLLLSAIATSCTLFGVGWLKGKVLDTARWRAGVETFLIGGGAAALAYLIGAALKGLAQ